MQGQLIEVKANGAHYSVKLDCVPRIGEQIEFFSHTDVASEHLPAHHYEVVKVVHRLADDIAGKYASHFAEIHVAEIAAPSLS